MKALPRRQRKPRANDIRAVAAEFSDNCFSHGNEVSDNISKRQRSIRAEATLDSRDGCTGEFYEYL